MMIMGWKKLEKKKRLIQELKRMGTAT